jgi:hypothetical protein
MKAGLGSGAAPVLPAVPAAAVPIEDDGIGEDVLGGPEGVHAITESGQAVAANVPVVEGRSHAPL